MTDSKKALIPLGMVRVKKIRVQTMHKRKLRSEFMKNNEYEQVVAQWKNNYLNYNDDNLNHMESAFISNGFNINSPETIERIKEANKAFPA